MPIKEKSWKKADYPNRVPSWIKHPYAIKDPLCDWKKASGWADTKEQANGIARALQVYGNKTKIIKRNNYYEVYYKKKK